MPPALPADPMMDESGESPQAKPSGDMTGQEATEEGEMLEDPEAVDEDLPEEDG